MSTMIPAGLLDTPDDYLFAFDGDRAVFRRMDRDSYYRSIFLDRRIAAATGASFSVPVADLIGQLDDISPDPGSPAWVFHVAHCGSTLLARALDLPRRSLVLREPLALRQLGVERAALGENESWRARLKLVTTLLGRRYRADAPAIVKANVPVNFMLDTLLPDEAAAPAILLYFPLRAYLEAILRSPFHRRWVVNVTSQLEPAIVRLAGSIAELDVAERAAALWLAQMRCYAELLARHGQARSLHAEELFKAPRSTVAAAALHLGIALSDAELEALEASGAFSRYSKDPKIAFDNEARLAQRREMAASLDPEIGEARRWLDSRLAAFVAPERLDNPLIGTSPPLL